MNKRDENGLTEKEFLAAYKPGDYERPSVTVDMMVMKMKEDLSCVQLLLIKRKAHPEIEKWALPGGFINMQESAYEAACRELKEETGLSDVYLEQLYTMSQPERDPRMRIIDIAYIALLPYGYNQTAVAGDDAKDAKWFDVRFTNQEILLTNDELDIKYTLKTEVFKNGVIAVKNYIPVSASDEKLAFDHAQIVLEGLMRIRNKVEYTGIMFNLVPREFTIPDLQRVYEVLIGKSVYPKVFRDKITDKLIPLDRSEKPITGRKSAAVYRYIDLNMEAELVEITQDKKYKNGVILMRAQPVHNGHIEMIKKAVEECERVLVVVGSANKQRTRRNPFSIEEREMMVSDALHETGLDEVEIMTLSDWSKEDAEEYKKEWGSFFYYNVANKLGDKTFILYYNDNPDIVKSWFTDAIRTNISIRHMDRAELNISSTKIREMLINEEYDKLKSMVPKSVSSQLRHLRSLLKKSENDDYMMD